LQQIKTWVQSGGLLFCRVHPESVEGQVWDFSGKEMADDKSSQDESLLRLFFEKIVQSQPALFPDSKQDNVYWTRFKDGTALILNYSEQEYMIDDVVIKPAEIFQKKN